MVQAKKPDPGAGDPQKQPQPFIAPMTQDPAKAAAEAAAKAALEAALQAAAPIQPPSIASPITQNTNRTLRIHTKSTQRVHRRNLQYAFLWLKSPGTLNFGISAKWKIVDNAKARKQQVQNDKIEKIQVARFEGEELIHFWVTDPLDPDGIEVTETKSGLQAKIAAWLFQEGIAPAPGLNQKFDVMDSPELMLGLPALCFHLDKAMKTHYFDPSGKKEEKGEASAKGTGKRKKAAPDSAAPKVGDPTTDEENE